MISSPQPCQDDRRKPHAPVLTPVTLTRAALLTLSLGSLGAASAADAAAEADPSELPAFMTLHVSDFSRAADVVLPRVAKAKYLRVVTSGGVTARTLARRYGVLSTTVKKIGSGKGTRLYRVALPVKLVERPAIRPSSVIAYRVRSGDTLSTIATRFGIRIVDLLGTNLDRPSLDSIQPGEVLNIPTGDRGLLITVKPGQTAMSLIAGYGADLARTARANDVLPTDLQVGDQLLLPGIEAKNFQQQLLARRDAEQKAREARERLRQYQEYLAYQASRQRQALIEKYRRQEQYEKYQTWMKSEERQARIREVERQQAAAAAAARSRAAAASAARARVQAAARARTTVRTASAPAVMSTGGTWLSWPMNSFRISSYYGSRDIRIHRRFFHGGIDLAAGYGTPIYAAAPGEVTQSGWGTYGKNVYTQNGNQTLIYGHMSRTAVYTGQFVRRGQLLGFVGCTGICTGPHLHFEIRYGGRAVNPLAYLP